MPYHSTDRSADQARLAGILEVVLDCIITFDHEGRIIDFNPAAEEAFGYTRAEVLGRDILDLIVPVRERGRHRDEKMARLCCGEARDRQGRRTGMAAVRSDGVEFPVELAIARMETDGQPIFAACLRDCGAPRGAGPGLPKIDLAERRRQQQLQAATYEISKVVLAGGDLSVLFAEVHRIIAGLMPAKNFYIALLSADGRELSFPYFVDEYVESAPSRPVSNGFTEFVLQSGQPQLVTAAELQALLVARGAYQSLDRPASQRIGAPLLVGGRAIGVIALQDYLQATAYSAEDLRLLNFVAEQTAVAVQRRQSEIALARAEQRYRSIFENAVEGLYLSSPAGQFLSVNPALARMLGYDSPAELLTHVDDIGRQFYVDGGRRDEFFAQIQRRDQVSDFESEVYRRDGSRIWISESVRVVRNAEGAIDHFEGLATDVTGRREAAWALQAAKEAADAASRAKSYFLASVSHELRTPLNGILGYTQILRRDSELTDRQREGLRVIHESADHLLALINDVLDLSKIEADRIELQPADFDLPEFVVGVERVFTPRADEKGILFESAVAADLPQWVRGDEQRLRQVVFNLVANAVKFTRTGGVVFSVQQVEDGAIRFSVSDTGPGIAPEDLARLFQPFTQVGQHSGSAACGTGLGLAISRSLVERMGGRLHVESKPGWGSRFWFEVALPAAAAAPAGVSDARRVTGYEGSRRRVLIVDDNRANRAVMVEMLAPLGFELAEAADGTAALAETDRFQPELVLMDLRLPGKIDGLEATRRLRRQPAGGALRIVAVSASAYEVDRSECFAAGCDGFLAKPFREEELWAVVGQMLGISWRQAGSEEAPPPPALPSDSATASEAAAIYELAAKGDVMAIRTRAQALLAQDPRYAPFAQGVLDLAGRFKMKAIRQFVGRYMK
jgi:PAS domain S-box-containing protein